MKSTSWRKELMDATAARGETLACLLFTTDETDPVAQQARLIKVLDTEWVREHGGWAPAIEAWSQNWLYRSRDYDGAFHLECVRRAPSGPLCRLGQADKPDFAAMLDAIRSLEPKCPACGGPLDPDYLGAMLCGRCFAAEVGEAATTSTPK